MPMACSEPGVEISSIQVAGFKFWRIGATPSMDCTTAIESCCTRVLLQLNRELCTISWSHHGLNGVCEFAHRQNQIRRPACLEKVDEVSTSRSNGAVVDELATALQEHQLVKCLCSSSEGTYRLYVIDGMHKLCA